jgi:hypothetical protein
MDDQCRTQPPSPPVVCSKNCNKCMASTTSRMLYYTLVKRLDERDAKNKKPTATATPIPHHDNNDDNPKKQKLNPIPDPIPNPKRRKLVEPPQFGTATLSKLEIKCNKKYYCYSKMQINNKKCCSECRLIIQEAADGTWSLL